MQLPPFRFSFLSACYSAEASAFSMVLLYRILRFPLIHVFSTRWELHLCILPPYPCLSPFVLCILHKSHCAVSSIFYIILTFLCQALSFYLLFLCRNTKKPPYKKASLQICLRFVRRSSLQKSLSCTTASDF